MPRVATILAVFVLIWLSASARADDLRAIVGANRSVAEKLLGKAVKVAMAPKRKGEPDHEARTYRLRGIVAVARYWTKSASSPMMRLDLTFTPKPRTWQDAVKRAGYSIVGTKPRRMAQRTAIRIQGLPLPVRWTARFDKASGRLVLLSQRAL
jgi:hypothetical protein